MPVVAPVPCSIAHKFVLFLPGAQQAVLQLLSYFYSFRSACAELTKKCAQCTQRKLVWLWTFPGKLLGTIGIAKSSGLPRRSAKRMDMWLFGHPEVVISLHEWLYQSLT